MPCSVLQDNMIIGSLVNRDIDVSDSSMEESLDEDQHGAEHINYLNRQKLVGRDVEIKMVTGALYRSLSLGADGLPFERQISKPPPYILCVHG